MTTKHFINDGTTLVQDSLHGLALSNPFLRYDEDIKAIINLRHDGNKNVTIISGGGAGHEPSFVGLVGDGLLSAAVSGSIFASPSVHQIQTTISRVGGSAGTLLVIMNYTGDVLHFHLAAEKARLAGFDTAVLVVGDDVSVGRRKSGRVGRRGLAGTVLVEKVLGALAKQGKMDLQQLCKIGEDLVNNLATVGAALDHVHIVGKPTTESIDNADQVEVGMGIHNEPGCYVIKPQPTISTLVDQMLDKLLDPTDSDRAYVSFSDKQSICLMVNNLGGVSNIEFSAITKAVVDRLGRWGITPIRIYSGAFMTSLDGKGFSITLLQTTPQILTALDEPATTPGWRVTPDLYQAYGVGEGPHKNGIFDTGDVDSMEPSPRSLSQLTVNEKDLMASLKRACDGVIAAEVEIDQVDSLVGDGDCGSTLARTAQAILREIVNKGNYNRDSGDIIQLLETLAIVVENNMDGTSGALYAIFLNALAASLRAVGAKLPKERPVERSDWVKASGDALQAVRQATPALVGDRTVMDALIPFIASLQSDSPVAVALAAAREGRDSTKGMAASLGRAVYVPPEVWSKVPDPGAMGLVYLLEGLLGA
ncbi:dihydroxyacetone kinase [Aspergillus caelatus]|uniref:Dihydroxyacetone kinase n=1 Tax=Aspergillus caelatus TaxID=61420 RepID=A0A5N7AA42_9EURO|nr:dihydroxyacetone kinase [Aspergillus caelatus]KAE8366036.1 dihydroxyacetone kinase [Aspergillus caelatus]